MPYLIGGVLLLIALVYAGRAFINADPQKLSRFFGWFVLGLGGIGAAALGRLADFTSIDFVYHICAFLPLLGLLTVFLPDVGRTLRPTAPASNLGKPVLQAGS